MTAHTAYIGMGSNLGDAVALFAQALALLHDLDGVTPGQLSPFYETAPVGGPPQPNYINAVASVTTSQSPTALLGELLTIETQLGRVRQERWGPRSIDLDLLIVDQLAIDVTSPISLQLPHPRLHLRRFVLAPLCDIAPSLSHPTYHKTIRELFEACPDYSNVILYEPPHPKK